MIIELPVSTFSKKIITKFDKKAPLQLNARNILMQQFGYVKVGRPKISRTALKILNDTILLQITDKIPKSKIPYLYQAGYAIHKLHLNNLMIFIESQVLIGGTASKAIKIFYDLYDLSDDDLNQESILRKWQRYYSPKKSLYSAKKELYIPTDTVKSNINHITIIDNIKKSEIFSKIVFENISFFITTNNKFRKTLLKHLKIYIYKSYLGYSSQKLADIYGLSVIQINNAVNNIKNILKYDKVLGEAINQNLNVDVLTS